MRAITYHNTKTTLPAWVLTIHRTWPRGLAYETATHFVHIFGFDTGLWTVCDVFATEQAQGTLQDWVVRVFGATQIEDILLDVGHTVEGAWRPGLYFQDDTLQGLQVSNSDARRAEQSLLLLVQRLDELLLFIEPSPTTLNTHSHKARELLILACTEIENYWQDYLRRAGQSGTFTTNDYVKLMGPLYLSEYEISLPRYNVIAPIRPFLGWAPKPGPTQTLPWYNDYNKTKHDRTINFEAASLLNCINAVAAAAIMFAIKFGPQRLTEGPGPLPSYFGHLFAMELRDFRPSTTYVPLIRPPTQNNLSTGRLRDVVEPRLVQPFTL